MNFSEFIQKEAIITDLRAQTKEGVIQEMVDALAKTDKGVKKADVRGVVDSILRREELGSTGIGHGIAVPHTKHVCVDKLVGGIAICQGEGVDFDSLDAEEVKLFFMLVSPPDLPGEHLRALEYITHQLKRKDFVEPLKACKTPEDVIKLLREADESRK